MAAEIRRWDMVMPGITVTENGTILLMLNKNIIALTVNGGLHITDMINSIKISLSKDGRVTAINHPKCNIFGYDSRVEIQAEHHKGKRYAKIYERGISFTTENRPVTFMIEAGGIKTTVDWFSEMDPEFTNRAFYFNSEYGPDLINYAINLLEKCTYWMTEWGQKNWKIGNIRISETNDGFVKIKRFNSRYQMSINNSLGSVMITTPFIHCTATSGLNGHMFIRLGNRRIHYDGRLFIAKNKGQFAGIDNDNNFKIF